MRVTAALFCYNQEKFVRNAVRDVLKQDADGLEIILSDDCSTDSTFDIISEEARQYCGRHKVFVQRTPRNAGLNAHINRVIRQATGDVVVPFAGDDRFHPSRARKLAAACQAKNALLVHSSCTFIGADEAEVEPINQEASFYRSDDLAAIACSNALFIGATASWHRELFSKYGPLPENRAYEDLILGFRAALERRVSFLAEPLVRYRVGTGASTQHSSDRNGVDARLDELLRKRDVLRARLQDASRFGLCSRDPLMHVMTDRLRGVEARLICYGPHGHSLLGSFNAVRPRYLRLTVSELIRRLRSLRRPKHGSISDYT